MSNRRYRNGLMATTVMAGATLLGLGQGAEAACALATPPNIYVCSGVNDTGQTVSVAGATVTTASGFGVDTTGGFAVTIEGSGPLSYIDTNASPLTATVYALRITAIGDYGLNPGSVTVQTNGTISGGTDGIHTENFGTGATSITTTGVVTGASGAGIAALNDTKTTGDLTIDAIAAVSGGDYGIRAENYGTGATRITTAGAVTATGDAGIRAVNGATTTDLTIEATAAVSGGGYGVYALNNGTGATSITTGVVTSTGLEGIHAVNNTSTTGGLTVDATEAVIGETAGIFAQNLGGGATTITAKGAVTGVGDSGIIASNYTMATDLKIDAAAVSGWIIGIDAFNQGSGTTSITTTGPVEGGSAAIRATSSTGQAIGIDLSGATHNSAQTATALAIITSGGATTLTNGGSLTGRVAFGEYADLVTNNAIWTTGGTSLFGAGIDSVMNATGATLVTASNGAMLETTTFNGLESLSNGGRLTMQDGGAGDRTVLSGDATLAPGSTYAIDIDAAQSDLLHANGAVTVTGSTIAVTVQGDLLVGTRYTVLTADGGLTGMFSSITGLLETAFYTLKDAYDANNAYLDVVRARDFAEVGITENQIAIGGGLDSLTGGVLRGAVASLATDAEARAAFDLLSGEVHASAKGMLLNDSRFVRDAAASRIRAAFGDAGAAPLPVMAYGEGGLEAVAADTDRFAAWGQAFGSWGDTDSDGNAATFDRSTGGLLMGADGLVGDWRVGLLGGYGHASFDADDRYSSGDSDNYHIGLYGGTNWDAVAFRTGAAYSWNSISTKRSVAFDGFADALSADYDAGTAQVFGELAYKVDANRFKFEPFANLAYVNVHTDGFTEKGGAAALTSQSSNTDATFTTLGLRASSDFALAGMSATAHGTLGWRHAFGDITPTSTFAFAGGDAFIIAGAPIAKDAVLVEAGLDLQLAANATLGLSYSGQFGGGVVDQGAKLDLGMKF